MKIYSYSIFSAVAKKGEVQHACADDDAAIELGKQLMDTFADATLCVIDSFDRLGGMMAVATIRDELVQPDWQYEGNAYVF